MNQMDSFGEELRNCTCAQLQRFALILGLDMIYAHKCILVHHITRALESHQEFWSIHGELSKRPGIVAPVILALEELSANTPETLPKHRRISLGVKIVGDIRDLEPMLEVSQRNTRDFGIWEITHSILSCVYKELVGDVNHLWDLYYSDACRTREALIDTRAALQKHSRWERFVETKETQYHAIGCVLHLLYDTAIEMVVDAGSLSGPAEYLAHMLTYHVSTVMVTLHLIDTLSLDFVADLRDRQRMPRSVTSARCRSRLISRMPGIVDLGYASYRKVYSKMGIHIPNELADQLASIQTRHVANSWYRWACRQATDVDCASLTSKLSLPATRIPDHTEKKPFLILPGYMEIKDSRRNAIKLNVTKDLGKCCFARLAHALQRLCVMHRAAECTNTRHHRALQKALGNSATWPTWELAHPGVNPNGTALNLLFDRAFTLCTENDGGKEVCAAHDTRGIWRMGHFVAAMVLHHPCFVKVYLVMCDHLFESLHTFSSVSDKDREEISTATTLLRDPFTINVHKKLLVSAYRSLGVRMPDLLQKEIVAIHCKLLYDTWYYRAKELTLSQQHALQDALRH